MIPANSGIKGHSNKHSIGKYIKNHTVKQATPNNHVGESTKSPTNPTAPPIRDLTQAK